jgi:acetyltransferase-like isoleucine patch superfamily enzyme
LIGRKTKIGARVIISTLKESMDARPLGGSERTETARGGYISKNVYIGDGCIIKGGFRISDNAIVRAGSVVLQASIRRFLPSRETAMAGHLALCDRINQGKALTVRA